MYQKDQYSSLLYNPNQNRERAQRPQTPLVGSHHHNSHSNFNHNQSYSRNPGTYSPHKIFPQGNNYRNGNISKSRISVGSSNSQLSFLNADQGEIFPQDLLFLLKNEDKNINSFKQKIQKQKSRVENDFAVLKTQIQHILQDLKLSVQAELDLVYKVFISKYAQIKGQVQQIRRLRKQILMANQVGGIISQKPNKQTSSNLDIMSQIEKDAEHFRNYRVYGYLSQMQKQKLNPILEICNQLILIGSIDSPFYRSKQMGLKHKDIKLNFAQNLSEIYQRLKDYVITPQSIIDRQKQQQQNNGNILKNLEQQSQFQLGQRQPARQAFDAMYPDNKVNSNNNNNNNNNIQWNQKKVNNDVLIPTGKKITLNKIGKSQKVLTTKWAESLNLKKLQRIVTDHTDAILCIFFIDSRHIATGSKDKTINVYTIDGTKVTTLRGHDASICSLSSVSNRAQTFLASGSDHGCCCLILWDTKTWTISSRIQAHSAAVTSIVDLEDGQHLVTGSYDKKIILYDHSKRQVISTQNTKSAVTSIVLTSDKQNLVSSGLDFTLLIWHIVKKSNGISLQLGRTINNNALICTLEASLIRPDVIIGATRDGKVKLFNINSQSEIQKSFQVSQNSIIELVAIQRQMKKDSPMILSCGTKDKNLTLTKMDSGAIQIVKVNGPMNIQFGHGIGPKIVVSSGGIMAILSQAATAKQFSLFQLELI